MKNYFCLLVCLLLYLFISGSAVSESSISSNTLENSMAFISSNIFLKSPLFLGYSLHAWDLLTPSHRSLTLYYSSLFSLVLQHFTEPLPTSRSPSPVFCYRHPVKLFISYPLFFLIHRILKSYIIISLEIFYFQYILFFELIIFIVLKVFVW